MTLSIHATVDRESEDDNDGHHYCKNSDVYQLVRGEEG
jgi:hypothetical protein